MPEALTAFLEARVLRTSFAQPSASAAIVTPLTCIAASIAEAFYGVPEKI